MKLPIRNYLATRLTIFIEPYCDQYDVPAGGEAVVTLDDGFPFSIDVHPEEFITIWDGGDNFAEVEIFERRQISSPPRPEPLEALTANEASVAGVREKHPRGGLLINLRRFFKPR
ncbi:hypothetical protein WBP07_01980 [Novosphingobium sp. BL-8A]|uniref:hypothetical protein n=1 Tax=Novosphingobium sp. BL-8A TaxID=3127639 RepID=UPI003756861B